jgi:hypothetical protein
MDAAYRAQAWAPVLHAIEAMPSGQADAFGLARTLYAKPLRVDYRTRETKDWSRSQLAVIHVWCDLVNAGLVEITRPADGVNPDLFVVSEAGHRWLAEHDTLTGSGKLP